MSEKDGPFIRFGPGDGENPAMWYVQLSQLSGLGIHLHLLYDDVCSLNESDEKDTLYGRVLGFGIMAQYAIEVALKTLISQDIGKDNHPTSALPKKHHKTHMASIFVASLTKNSREILTHYWRKSESQFSDAILADDLLASDIKYIFEGAKTKKNHEIDLRLLVDLYDTVHAVALERHKQWREVLDALITGQTVRLAWMPGMMLSLSGIDDSDQMVDVSEAVTQIKYPIEDGIIMFAYKHKFDFLDVLLQVRRWGFTIPEDVEEVTISNKERR